MDDIEKCLFALKEKYESQYEALALLKQDIIRFEYAKGGLVFHRGPYSPELSIPYSIAANYSGRFVKTADKPSFTFGFDRDDRLIYAEKHPDWYTTEEFILYLPDMTLGITYNSITYALTHLTVCLSEGERLQAVYYACLMEGMQEAEFDLSEEFYQYTDGRLSAIELVTGRSRYPQKYHTRYQINADKTVSLDAQWTTRDML